jgi:hypothetical protein
MKFLKLSILLVAAFSLLIIISCNGSGGSDASSGTVSMSITDAKPLLPEGVTNLWITFEEILAHKPGGGWITLPMVESPYTIDLLQFYDGNTTEFVPPTALDYGRYTQIRIAVIRAMIRFDNGRTTGDYTVVIPSENLKTDKNFTFDVQAGGTVDITIDFDLSKSIVVTDSSGTPSYKLKPVLHIVQTSEAATIHGSIANASFVDSQNAIVTVISSIDDEEYTKVEVSQSDTEDPTEFNIYWLVPDQGYRVEIDFDPESGTVPVFTEEIGAINLQPGDIFELNGSNPI